MPDNSAPSAEEGMMRAYLRHAVNLAPVFEPEESWNELAEALYRATRAS